MRLVTHSVAHSVLRCVRTVAPLVLALAGSHVQAATWYVATNGSDSNAGTITAPFASVNHAESVASTGDTVYIRGGTYTNLAIAGSDSTFQYVTEFTKSGITYAGYPGDTRPVFDLSSISPTLRVVGFEVTGSNNTFQDIELTGIQSGTQTNGYCWRVSTGDGNHLLRLVNHDAQGTGVYIRNTASNTLVENCDSHDLIGVSGISDGNCDGFGCHSSGVGNTFRGCRSWHNSDDGYDCLNAAGAVTFDHCWSYNNGVYTGNGNGFKVGGWGCSGGTFPNPPPVHTVTFCLAANNQSHNFYANHQPGQSANWYNNTSYNGVSADYDMLEGVDSTNCSVSGYREVLHNNIAYVGTLVADDADPASQETYNSWTLSHTPTDADFLSVDPTQMTAPRNSDGSLPNIAFMALAQGSFYIDAGTNLGFPYNGAAPDLGCFESGSTTQAPAAPANLTATAGNNQVALAWSASSGANGYNVKRATVSGGPYTTIASSVATTSYTDTTAVNGTTYFYVVSAVNSAGESPNSNEASATPVLPAPAAPTGLTATAGNSQVSLSWTASSGATSYNVKRSTVSGGPYTTIASGVTSTSYSDTTVTNGTTYFYVVSAVNSSGESANSAEVTATPSAPTAPAAPTGLTAVAGKKKITLSWNTDAGATSYNVKRSNVSGGPYTTIATGVTTTTYTNSGLTSRTTYYYVVSGVNAVGEGPNSAEASATAQ